MPTLRPLLRKFNPWLRTIAHSKGTSKNSNSKSGGYFSHTFASSTRRSEKRDPDGSYLELGTVGKKDASVTTAPSTPGHDEDVPTRGNKDSIVRTVDIEMASVRQGAR